MTRTTNSSVPAAAPGAVDAGPVEVRRLTSSDSIAELTALIHRAYAGLAAMGLRFGATDQPEAVTLERVGQGECYVAVADGCLAGTVLFTTAADTHGSPWLDRPEVAGFSQFAVEPCLQGRGVGTRLLAAAERRASATGALEMALETVEPATHLVDWYGRHGYRLIEHARWRDSGYRSVIMSKPLGTG